MIIMNFTWGSLEIFMVVIAGLFLICSVLAPIFQKRNVLTTIGCIYTGVICSAYFTLCTGMLNTLESDGDYGIPIDYITESHTTYTKIFFFLIFGLSLIGILLPTLTKLKWFDIHKIKLFNIYAIVSTVCFATFTVSLFTTYSSYSLFALFIPLHWILPLTIYSLSVHDNSKTSQFAISLVCSILLLIMVIVVIALAQWSDATPLQIVLCIVLIISPLLSLSSIIRDKFVHAITIQK